MGEAGFISFGISLVLCFIKVLLYVLYHLVNHVSLTHFKGACGIVRYRMDMVLEL